MDLVEARSARGGGLAGGASYFARPISTAPRPGEGGVPIGDIPAIVFVEAVDVRALVA